MPVGPPVGEPLGFPKCPTCPYAMTGPAHVCYRCANATIERIGADACPICSQLTENGTCPNWLCSEPSRRISRISAIAYSSGPLRKTILRYKYDGKQGWALIFGRLLYGWLERNMQATPPDIIVANPTFVGPGGANFGHTERVVEVAEKEDVLGRWSFDVASQRAVIKVSATPRSASNSAAAKGEAAEAHREALRIPRPGRVHGKHVLVYDDVCTTGRQLDAVAATLMYVGGAASVSAVVLARAPWRR